MKKYQANIVKNGTDPKCKICDDKIKTIDENVMSLSQMNTNSDMIELIWFDFFVLWQINLHGLLPRPSL